MFTSIRLLPIFACLALLSAHPFAHGQGGGGGLAGLQVAYSNQVVAIRREAEAARAKVEEYQNRRLDTLQAQYAGQLEQARLTLIRLKKPDEARAVQEELDRLRAAVPLVGGEGGGRPPTGGRAGGKAPAPGSHKGVSSFETERDLKSLEVRAGPPVARVERHATDGRYALAAHAGNLLVLADPPADWRGYRALEIDFHLEGQKSLPVEITIGDQAWLDNQTYWNRHNRVEEIKDGDSTMSIPTKDLYRGEKDSKNKELSKELELSAIRYLALQLGAESAATVHIDAIRLVK